MDFTDIYVELIFFVLGTMIGFIANYYSNKRSLMENQKLFEQRFGPQLLKVLVRETDFKYKKFSEESSEAKESIGRYVANRWGIKGSTILLDAGTTTERVARNLAHLDITDLVICTANPIAALHFMSRSRQNCFLFPGEIDENYAGTISNEDLITSVVKFAEMKTKNETANTTGIRHKIGIIGALPIFPEIGPCSNDDRTVHIKRTILKLSQQIVIVVDISKFYPEGKYKGVYYPVFESLDEWKNLLKSEKITIVTYQNSQNEKNLKRIRDLNNQYFASVHCVYPE